MPPAGELDLAAAGAWIRSVVTPTGPIQLVRVRPWASVVSVPTADGLAWIRDRDPMSSEARADFDVEFAVVLRRALARIAG
jgi:hypothetical protein